jgi:histidinol-phosphate aminotransferase
MNPRDLSTHAEYRAGRGVEEVARELGRDPDSFVKLASNENPLGPSPAAVDAIEADAQSVHRYPTASHTDLTERIAEHWGVSPTQIWLANGSDGALDYLARAMLDPGDRVLVPDPGFAYYPMSARYHHGLVDEYRLASDGEFRFSAERVLAAYEGHRIVYLTSPHNPTGGTFDPEAVRTIARETDSETLVVVDEAYGEFADTETAIPLVEDREDVAILRTFSKAYGLAGLRLGYAVTPVAWADVYARVNTPFAASRLACRAGLAAMEDEEHVERSVRTARWSRTHLREALPVPTYPSEANFVLADVSEASSRPETTPASTVAAAALERGLILRDCTSFGLPGCVRITCGTREETRRAVDILEEVFPV